MTQTTGTGIFAGPQGNCPLSLEAKAGNHTWLKIQVIHTTDATAEETAKAESLAFDAGLAVAFAIRGDDAKLEALVARREGSRNVFPN